MGFMEHDGDLQRFSRPQGFMDRWIVGGPTFRSLSIVLDLLSPVLGLVRCTCTLRSRNRRDVRCARGRMPNRIWIQRNAWEGPAWQNHAAESQSTWFSQRPSDRCFSLFSFFLASPTCRFAGRIYREIQKSVSLILAFVIFAVVQFL